MQGQLRAQNGTTKPNPKREDFDIKKVLAKIIGHWPLYALCIVVSFVIGYLYLRYSTPVYKIHAGVLIKDDKKSGEIDNAELLSDLGLSSKGKNVDNEVEILKSRTLMHEVVKDLQLNISYLVSGNVKTNESFNNRPFNMRFIPLFEDSIKNKTYNYQVKLINTTGFEITGNDKNWKGKWGDTLVLPPGRIVMERTYFPFEKSDNEYTVNITSYKNAVRKYMSALSVQIANKQASIINLTIDEETPVKGEAILDKLIKVYMQASVDDKNLIADSTIGFIDNRLQLVGEELTGIEKEIQTFKQDNTFTDLTEQSKVLLSSNQDAFKELSKQQVQLNIITSLEQYLKDNNNSRRIVPASLTIQNDVLNSFIDKYNTLQLERQRMLVSNTEDNPVVKNFDQQLDNIKADLMESMASVKRSMEVGIRSMQGQANSANDKLRQLPPKERIYLEYSRQQNIKQELYLFLLKKREETAISKSSTIANARIIDAPAADEDPFKPKRASIMMIAMLLGLLIPSAVVYLKEILSHKITSKTDITGSTDIPIIAEIGHFEGTNSVAVSKNSTSPLSEQFRALRTNLQFTMAHEGAKTVLLTSSMSGEGKSFVAINLATTLALSGKKVVLMELDLRKPKISKHLNLDSRFGFSSYVIKQAEYNQILLPSGLEDSLYVITSGPIPPNPAELLMMPRVEELFTNLKRDFDYIIIDSAPIGLVTDAQLLGRFADTTLYVVRQGYTLKPQLQIPDGLVAEQKMSGLHLVVNDVKMSFGYGYGYGYGYGGYGNLEENGKKGGWKKIFMK